MLICSIRTGESLTKARADAAAGANDDTGRAIADAEGVGIPAARGTNFTGTRLAFRALKQEGSEIMADEDARAVEGILLGAGIGAVLWTIVAAVAVYA